MYQPVLIYDIMRSICYFFGTALRSIVLAKAKRMNE